MFYFYDVERARVGDVKRETEQRESESATDRAPTEKRTKWRKGRRRRKGKSNLWPDTVCPQPTSQRQFVRDYVSDMTAAASSDNDWLRYRVVPLSFVCWLRWVFYYYYDVHFVCECECSYASSCSCKCSWSCCCWCRCWSCRHSINWLNFCWGFALQCALSHALLSHTISTFVALLHYWYVRSRALSVLLAALTLCGSLAQNSCSAYTKCKQTVKKLSGLLCCALSLSLSHFNWK